MSAALVKTYYSRDFTQLSGSDIARPFDVTGGWIRCRVGALVSLSGAATVTPTMAFGICRGGTNLFGDATTTHWAGLYSTGAFTYGTGAYTTGSLQWATRVGTTITAVGGSSGYDLADLATYDHVAGWFVDIVRPASGTTYPCQFMGFDSAPSGANTMDEATFDSIMEFGWDMNSRKPAGYYYYSSSQTIDEAANGEFNHVNVHWSGTTTQLNIDKLVVSLYFV